MKLRFKRKSLLSKRTDVVDEYGGLHFQIKSKFFFDIYVEIFDRQGTHLGVVRKELFTFTPKFIVYINEKYIGKIKKDMTLLHPKYTLPFYGWIIDDTIFSGSYTVVDGMGRNVMRCHKKNITGIINEVEVFNPKDALYSIMIALAVQSGNIRDSGLIDTVFNIADLFR